MSVYFRGCRVCGLVEHLGECGCTECECPCHELGEVVGDPRGVDGEGHVEADCDCHSCACSCHRERVASPDLADGHKVMWEASAHLRGYQPGNGSRMDLVVAKRAGGGLFVVWPEAGLVGLVRPHSGGVTVEPRGREWGASDLEAVARALADLPGSDDPAWWGGV